MSAAEDRRRARHTHPDTDGNGRAPRLDEATCGACGRSWCWTCGPTPAALCPFENGDPHTVKRAGIRLRGGAR